MKTASLFIPTMVAVALLAATLTTHAQIWETLLPNPQFAPGYEGSSLLVDPFSADTNNPELFVGCSSDLGSVLHLDNNGLPTFVDTDLGIVHGMAFNPANSTLYAVGGHLRLAGAPSSTTNQDVWNVRKSGAAGGPNTWMEDDSFCLSTTAFAMALAITTDANGNVYVCGMVYPASGNSHWAVRELPFGGSSWRTVVDVAGKSTTADRTAYAQGMLFFPGNSANPTNAVFAVGILNAQWTVMRSQDQGASWQIVDAWSPGNNLAATANKAACDSAGDIYVVGYRGVVTSATGWVVRKSSDGGNTWSLVLDVSEGAYCKASGVSVDGAGNVWVSGETEAAPTKHSTTGGRWTVLKNGVLGTLSANNSAFLQLRQLPFANATYTVSNPSGGVAADSSGNVFVAGELLTSTSQYIGLQRLGP